MKRRTRRGARHSWKRLPRRWNRYGLRVGMKAASCRLYWNRAWRKSKRWLSLRRSAANTRQETAKERLAGQVAALLETTTAVPEDRLAQELALLAVKGDVLEEIDRLKAHIAQARELLGERCRNWPAA